MNLLLFREYELDRGLGWVRGERASHIREVLKKTVGDTLKVGVSGRGRGQGTVVRDEPEGIAVEIADLTTEPAPHIHLIVALPRPLALSRLLHTAASFGVLHIDLIRAWKVPRSYFDSPRLEPSRVDFDLQLGAEQGGQVWIPTLAIHEGFRKFMEDTLPVGPLLGPLGRRFLLDPEATRCFPQEAGAISRLTLALGPEGGFIPAELTSFEQAGFEPICLGRAILTTEIAIAASLAQLALLASAR